jgi:hypothetical protein
MKSGCFKIILVTGLLFAGKQFGWSQGFVNLNFEAASVPSQPTQIVNATNLFPGWVITPSYSVGYDDVSLTGASISIIDTNSYFSSSIQGKYYALLVSANDQGYGIPISMGQTGQIPVSAKSITFWGDIGGLQITFNNQPLFFSSLGSTANYSIYGADISVLAGQTGQLLFTLPPYVGAATIDNIQFSSVPVPEPGGWALAALGTLLLSPLRRQN